MEEVGRSLESEPRETGEGPAPTMELIHLAKHALGEAYRRYAGGYVPVGSADFCSLQNLHSRHPWRSGSGIPACARPTIGLPQGMPGRCFINLSFPAFLRTMGRPSPASGTTQGMEVVGRKLESEPRVDPSFWAAMGYRSIRRMVGAFPE